MEENSVEKLDSMRIINDISTDLASELEGQSLEIIRRILDELRQLTIQKCLIADAKREKSIDTSVELPSDLATEKNCPGRPGQLSELCPVGCPGENDCIENQTR